MWTTSQLFIVISEKHVSPAEEVAGKGFKYYILINRVIILYYYYFILLLLLLLLCY